MPFLPLSPTRGAGTGRGTAFISIAWRQNPGSKRFSLAATFSKLLCAQNPFLQQGASIAVTYCPDTNRARFFPAEPGELGFTLHAVGLWQGKPMGTLTLRFPLHHIGQNLGKIGAGPAPHTIEPDGAIIVSLPAWAENKAVRRAREAAQHVRMRLS